MAILSKNCQSPKFTPCQYFVLYAIYSYFCKYLLILDYYSLVFLHRTMHWRRQGGSWSMVMCFVHHNIQCCWSPALDLVCSCSAWSWSLSVRPALRLLIHCVGVYAWFLEITFMQMCVFTPEALNTLGLV